MLWTAVRPQEMRWAQWEVDNSLFHAETGETHLLSELPAALLQMISEQPRALPWLCRRSADLCEAPDDASWQEKIESILVQLETLALAERQ